jgi:hypothetical protein
MRVQQAAWLAPFNASNLDFWVALSPVTSTQLSAGLGATDACYSALSSASHPRGRELGAREKPSSVV